MKVGIIGSGNIGGSLGRLWAQAGHQVLFSSRHPERLEELVRRAGVNARAGTVDEAADFGEAILEAVPFGKLNELPVERLQGKVVLTAANYYPRRDGRIDLGGKSESKFVAASLLRGVKLVKAFNMMRSTVMEALADGKETRKLVIFIAGDDADAKQVATKLVMDAKFVPLDVGSLSAGVLFQTNGPLYDTQYSLEEAQQALRRAHKP
ncbi:MAG TPA: NAD(P)-binding domain-containing protein [Tepidisphaeraceae bacterium]|jgi:hypothetical protein